MLLKFLATYSVFFFQTHCIPIRESYYSKNLFSKKNGRGTFNLPKGRNLAWTKFGTIGAKCQKSPN